MSTKLEKLIAAGFEMSFYSDVNEYRFCGTEGTGFTEWAEALTVIYGQGIKFVDDGFDYTEAHLGDDCYVGQYCRPDTATIWVPANLIDEE